MAKACSIVELRVRKHKYVALLDCGSTAEVPAQQIGEMIRLVFKGRELKVPCPDCKDE